jgi:hypothetical protein
MAYLRSAALQVIPAAAIDYEEGTFTPLILAVTSNPTCSYSVQVGQYVKVGNIYLVMARTILTAKSGGSGRIEVNLPSVPLDVGADFMGGSPRCAGYDTNQRPNYCSPVRNSARVMFGHFNSTSSPAQGGWENVDIGESTTTGDTQFTVTYHAQ